MTTIDDALLAPRTIPPVVDGLVARPRLIDQMDAAAERLLTLISAPAGAGKTALVASWVKAGRHPGPVAWVSLDGGELDRDLFWTLVAHAGRRPGRGGRHEPTPEGFLAAVTHHRRPTVLVLDDFHAVEDPEIARDVAHLLDHAPAGLRIVIATRRDPPLRLSRLRLDGQVAEIRARDLAFTPDETEQLLAGHAAELTSHDIFDLWRHTEGWAAALRMAELTLSHHPQPARFLRDFAGDDHSIADYMLSEVLDLLPAPVREFMLRTSIVAAVNGELADAMTEGSGGAATLRRLTHENAMVSSVEGSPGWYRYHPLLRDLLRVELGYERGAEVRPLGRRAATWLAADGQLLLAIRQAMDASDWEQAARILADGWVDLLLDGDLAPVRDLVARVGPPVLADAPELQVALAAACVADGDPGRTDAALARARAQAGAVAPERRDVFELALATVTLRHRLRHGPLELPDPDESGAGPESMRPGLRALLLAHRGAVELWRGEHRAAELDLEAAAGAAEQHDAPYVVALALSHLAVLDTMAGAFPRAVERAARAVEAIEAGGWEHTPAAAAAYGVRAEVEYLRDEIDLAQQSLELAARALDATPERGLRGYLLSVRLRLLVATGRGDSALGVLRFEQRLLDGDLPAAVEPGIVALEALLLHDLGEHEEAVGRLEAAMALAPSAEVATALARLCLAEGAVDDALALTASLSERWTGRAPVIARVQALGVEALAGDRRSEHGAAADALEHALRLAEPAGLRRPLTQLGPGLRPLLHRQIRRGTAHRTLVDELLAGLDRAAARRPAALDPVEPLSERELAVLRYLPTMMSNTDIGGELFISVNTVKTHLRQIYRKLDVSTRRGAVERGRELHLLGPRSGASREG